jgi:hypothetical protein
MQMTGTRLSFDLVPMVSPHWPRRGVNHTKVLGRPTKVDIFLVYLAVGLNDFLLRVAKMSQFQAFLPLHRGINAHSLHCRLLQVAQRQMIRPLSLQGIWLIRSARPAVRG